MTAAEGLPGSPWATNVVRRSARLGKRGPESWEAGALGRQMLEAQRHVRDPRRKVTPRKKTGCSLAGQRVGWSEGVG
jgi:hypothetical protein